MSVRGFGGYGIGPRTPPLKEVASQEEHNGDSFGGFAKSLFLGTLSVPLRVGVSWLSIVPIFLGDA